MLFFCCFFFFFLTEVPAWVGESEGRNGERNPGGRELQLGTRLTGQLPWKEGASTWTWVLSRGVRMTPCRLTVLELGASLGGGQRRGQASLWPPAPCRLSQGSTCPHSPRLASVSLWCTLGRVEKWSSEELPLRPFLICGQNL